MPICKTTRGEFPPDQPNTGWAYTRGGTARSSHSPNARKKESREEEEGESERQTDIAPAFRRGRHTLGNMAFHVAGTLRLDGGVSGEVRKRVPANSPFGAVAPGAHALRWILQHTGAQPSVAHR